MQIFKYVLYLAATFVVSLLIFVSTLPTEYEAKAEIEVEIPYDLAYAYFHKLDFWSSLFRPVNQSSVIVTEQRLLAYDDLLEDSFEWNYFSLNENGTTEFKWRLDDVILNSKWRFTPTSQGTKFEWVVTGEASFTQKIAQFFLIRDARKVVDEWLNKTLDRISQKAQRDFLFQSIEVQGVVTLNEFSGIVVDSITTNKNKMSVLEHLSQKIQKYKVDETQPEKIQKRITQRYDGLTHVFVYHSISTQKDTQSVYYQKREPLLSLKVVISGIKPKERDIEKAINAYFEGSEYERRKPFEHIEIEKVNQKTSPFSFEWVTEWYVPVRKKFKYQNNALSDSITFENETEVDLELAD